MNKKAILSMICDRVELGADSWYWTTGDLQRDLDGVAGRSVIVPRLPKSAAKAFEILKQRPDWNVSMTSRVLAEYFPDDFLFYRVGQLEPEIFAGFEYFRDTEPCFDFDFSSVGADGYDRYQVLSQQMLDYGRHVWPETDAYTRQRRLICLMYDQIARLFLKPSDFDRYWLMVSQQDSFDCIDDDGSVTWSGRKEIKRGDIVFFYETSPVSAITKVGRVVEDHVYYPNDWWGLFAKVDGLQPVQSIPFSAMRQDEILGQWGAIRKQLQGVRTEPIPHLYYNRLLEFLNEDDKRAFDLKAEQLEATPSSGKYTSEKEFEDKVLVPLLKELAFQFDRQVSCKFSFGAGAEYRGRADFVVQDSAGDLTLVESKLRLLKSDLGAAKQQALSYALFLGLPSFILAAPEGLWVYSIDRHVPTLVEHFEGVQGMPKHELRQLLLKLRQDQGRSTIPNRRSRA
ncbi:MAG: hypothetical protein JWO45_208 [Spartobacteria bacterium]|nr:hypothetical protein [Spartobacteria bacterium]